MKRILSIAAIVFTLVFSGFESNTAKGIDFYKGSWPEALAESKKSGKPIFADMYASWCGPCKALKRTTFKDADVGAYFNKNFINISIDGETEEGKILMNRYGLTSYPALLIVGSDGKLKTKATGYMKLIS